MPTRSALTVTDTVAEEMQRTPMPLLGGAIGEQAAFVRALVDEVDRHHPADRRVVPLREQLGDELPRLAHHERRGRSPRRRWPVETGPSTSSSSTMTTTRSVRPWRCSAPSATPAGPHERRGGARDFDRQPAAIVLSDWSMPGMSGLELCAALKRREPRPYVILATGFHDNARLLDGVRGGADDFLRKPLDLDELEARLLSATRLIGAVDTVAALQERLCSVRAESETGATLAPDRRSCAD